MATACLLNLINGDYSVWIFFHFLFFLKSSIYVYTSKAILLDFKS